MFQVVVQSAMRQLKSKLRLPAPPSNSTGEKKARRKTQRSDRFYFGVSCWRRLVDICHVLQFAKQLKNQFHDLRDCLI